MANEENLYGSTPKILYSSEAIGLQLRALRHTQRNLTQKALAERIGCSSNTISQIEMGLQNMSIEQMYYLCGEFGVEPNYFFIGTMPELEYIRPIELFKKIFPDLKYQDQVICLEMLEFFWKKKYPDASYEERLREIPRWNEIFHFIEQAQTAMRKDGLNPSENNKFYLHYSKASKED